MEQRLWCCGGRKVKQNSLVSNGGKGYITHLTLKKVMKLMFQALSPYLLCSNKVLNCSETQPLSPFYGRNLTLINLFDTKFDDNK